MMPEPIWISLALTLFLMGVHFATPHLRRLPLVPEVCTISFSGGFAVAYVFLHLLPGLAEHGETIGEMLSETYAMTPIRNLIIYLMSLVGFLTFLFLERVAQHRKETGKGDQGFGFYVHIVILMIYNGIITYTLPIHVEADLGFALIFTLMIGFHFLTVDRTLEEHFPKRFGHQGRLILMVSLLLGWLLAWLPGGENIFTVGMMTAFIGGGVLMNVFRHEMPSLKKQSFRWFLVGALVGTALLVVVTVLEPHP